MTEDMDRIALEGQIKKHSNVNRAWWRRH